MGNHNKPGYVYFLNARDTNKYKIGLTIDLDRRLKELNSGQAPDPVDCIYSIRVSDMKLIEDALHQRFSAYRHHGEWFVFEQHDLDTVRDEYDRLQSQYPYRTEKPKKRSHDKTPEAVIRYIHSNNKPTSNSSCLGLLFWLTIILMGLGATFGIPDVSGNSKLTLSETPKKTKIVKISTGPNYSGANLRVAPNGKMTGRSIPNGTEVLVISENNGWCESDVGWFSCNLGK